MLLSTSADTMTTSAQPHDRTARTASGNSLPVRWRGGGEPGAQAVRCGPRQLVVGQVQVGEGGEGSEERGQLSLQVVVG